MFASSMGGNSTEIEAKRPKSVKNASCLSSSRIDATIPSFRPPRLLSRALSNLDAPSLNVPPKPFPEAASEPTREALLAALAERDRELAEARERQTATAEILRVISQSPTDARPVFESIVLTAARLLHCGLAMVHLCDGGFLSDVAAATRRVSTYRRSAKPRSIRATTSRRERFSRNKSYTCRIGRASTCRNTSVKSVKCSA